jgi:hypothetical protein
MDDSLEVRVDGAVVGTVQRRLIPERSSPSLAFGEGNSTPGASRSRWAELSLTPVPEPGRAALLLAGGALLVLARGRRARSSRTSGHSERLQRAASRNRYASATLPLRGRRPYFRS